MGYPMNIVVKHALGDVVICMHQVNGLRYGGRYRVIEVLSDQAFYYGNVVRVLDLSLNAPAPHNHNGYFAWRFMKASA
jgi:hypothetical protein